MTVAQTLQWLWSSLMPTGRAFRIPEPTPVSVGFPETDGILYRFFRAINVVLVQVYADANQILNDLLPDNPGFDIDDAHRWYARLGLYDSGSVSLADMKLAIAQKMSWPVTPLDKQHEGYIQAQLQAAGFNVFVYKNKFSDGGGGFITKTPGEVLGIDTGNAELGGFNLGELNLGAAWADDGITLIANYLEEIKDAGFDVGDNYRSTFFIAGATVDVFADVDVNRKTELRQLILTLKAQHMCGFMFVNYI